MTDTTTTQAATRRIYSPVQRDAAVFLETTAESGGQRTLLEVELAPGGGNSPHRHMTYSERFEVIEGELAVRLGDAELALGPGDAATVPIGAVHCFANRTDAEVRFRVEIAPGHRGFEQALQIVYGLAEDGLVSRDGTPNDPLVLALLGEMGEMRLAGPKAVITPILALLARLARRRGLEQRLVERYCRY